ncbi:hypothetical protein HPB48_005242 [Haemaphysalis longicornis]|uniref:Uncharacterized protein n=1 Tax=Haemaphysalis longicornis TaxID=44386 RepID=A0A9J6FQS4_HAELO|nr:hypothetical protein HPB48_005242 [Haemaphysalis longicornis]
MMLALGRVFGKWRHLAEEERLTDFTLAILNAANVSGSMSAAQLVRFFAEMSQKYGLPAVVSFRATQSPDTVTLSRNTDCLQMLNAQDLVSGAVRIFNSVLNSTLKVTDVIDIDKKVRGLKGDKRDVRAKGRGIRVVPFSGVHRINWTSTLNDFVFPNLPNVVKLSQSDADRLDELIQLLADASNQPASVAYSIICTAVSSIEAMMSAQLFNDTQGDQIPCQPLELCEIDNLDKARLTQTPVGDKRITDMFSRILDEISFGVNHSRWLFDQSDLMWSLRQLKRVELLLPEDIALASVPRPTLTQSFSVNFLALRSHSFTLKKIRLQQNLPEMSDLSKHDVSRRGRTIYIPTEVYKLLKAEEARDTVLNLAAIGVGLASELWSFLFEQVVSEEALQKLAEIYSCFEKEYRVDSSDEHASRKTFHVALGLATVQRVGERRNWLQRYDFNTTTLSRAQLFLLSWVYNQCRTNPSGIYGYSVNGALMNSPFFKDAFSCSSAVGTPPPCFKAF